MSPTTTGRAARGRRRRRRPRGTTPRPPTAAASTSAQAAEHDRGPAGHRGVPDELDVGGQPPAALVDQGDPEPEVARPRGAVGAGVGHRAASSPRSRSRGRALIAVTPDQTTRPVISDRWRWRHADDRRAPSARSGRGSRRSRPAATASTRLGGPVVAQVHERRHLGVGGGQHGAVPLLRVARVGPVAVGPPGQRRPSPAASTRRTTSSASQRFAGAHDAAPSQARPVSRRPHRMPA